MLKRSALGKDLQNVFAKGRSPRAYRKTAFILTGVLVLLLINVLGEIKLNEWQAAVFSAIEKKNLNQIFNNSILFIGSMLVLLLFVSGLYYLADLFKIELRARLSEHLLKTWLVNGRPYRLSLAGNDELHPDQRIQDDLRRFCELTSELSVGALKAIFLLVGFTSVLWVLSEGIVIPFNGLTFSIPGYMVWFSALYASAGTILAVLVGRPLLSLNDKKYSEEADLRSSLMRVIDHSESIAFHQGEDAERATVDRRVSNVLRRMHEIAVANARLCYVTWGHGWAVVLIPVLLALPGYLQGKLDFGGLMLAVGAFGQVQNSMRWMVANYPIIAEWRTLLNRISSFLQTLEDAERDESTALDITYLSDSGVQFSATTLALFSGRQIVKSVTGLITSGSRVLFKGESGTGKSTLLRALGGLWPWGTGQIQLPPRSELSFLPQRPYLPIGSLRACITYPRPAQSYSHAEVSTALERVNLAPLLSELDVEGCWDRKLSLGQQQRLAFARMLLAKPKWIFLDEATSALDSDNEDRMMSIFEDDLASSTIISVGHRSTLDQYHDTAFVLKACEGGASLSSDDSFVRNRGRKPADSRSAFIA